MRSAFTNIDRQTDTESDHNETTARHCTTGINNQQSCICNMTILNNFFLVRSAQEFKQCSYSTDITFFNGF